MNNIHYFVNTILKISWNRMGAHMQKLFLVFYNWREINIGVHPPGLPELQEIRWLIVRSLAAGNPGMERGACLYR